VNCCLTADVLMTIRMARSAGFAIPKECETRARDFLSMASFSTDLEERGTRYRNQVDASFGGVEVTAAGVLGMYSHGPRRTLNKDGCLSPGCAVESVMKCCYSASPRQNIRKREDVGPDLAFLK
jgi:hypothetical protein